MMISPTRSNIKMNKLNMVAPFPKMIIFSLHQKHLICAEKTIAQALHFRLSFLYQAIISYP